MYPEKTEAQVKALTGEQDRVLNVIRELTGRIDKLREEYPDDLNIEGYISETLKEIDRFWQEHLRLEVQLGDIWAAEWIYE